MKLVVERASQRVVGAHMIGPDAGEVIQGIAIAVKLGATKAQFDADHRHPSHRGRGVRHAAGEEQAQERFLLGVSRYEHATNPSGPAPPRCRSSHPCRKTCTSTSASSAPASPA